VIVLEVESRRVEYDLGDGWEHAVVVEEVRARAGRRRPACLADPTDEPHAELLEGIAGGFDPEAFDLEAVSRIFATVADLSS
jgi:hypothetical protein